MKLTELYNTFISDKLFSTSSERKEVIAAYQSWVALNRPFYVKYSYILAILFMAILIPFDFLLFTNGLYFARIRVIFIVIMLLNIIFLSKRWEKVSENKIKDYSILVLLVPGLLFCLLYEYWLLAASSEIHNTVLIANYMVIFFATFYLYRFWKEQYLLSLICIVGLILIPIIKMDLLLDCILLIIFHLCVNVMFFFSRRQLVSSMYVDNLKIVQKELQDEVSVIRHKSEINRKLEVSEEKYRTLFSSIADPVFIFDQATNDFLECNQAVLDLYGYTKVEILKMKPVDLHLQKERIRVQENITNDLNEDHNYIHITKEGLEKQVEVHTNAITYQGQSAWISIVHDITELKQLEAQLRHAQKLESITRLTGGIAHDFNNILGSIFGSVDMILMNVSEDHPARRFAHVILDKSQKAADLVRQMMAYTRQQHLNPEPMNINKTIKDLTILLDRALEERIKLKLVLADNLKPINGDTTAIDQIVMNLCINATDAMKEGGKLTVRTENLENVDKYIGEHPELKPGEYVLLNVTDTGHGIESENLEKIFDPFFTTKEVGE